MGRLSVGKSLLVGLTLFSMFFGAGNLIFPPFLGAEAGTNTWPAMAGFAASAVGLPILGVIAVARSGGLDRLAGRAHPAFASLFTLLIYLSIGPCLAIPRTASTSYEMAVVPFIGNSIPPGMAQAGYSVVFFCAALALAMRPDKLTDRLGRVLTPCLLGLILIVFTGCVLHPAAPYGAPAEAYVSAPAVKGFLDGYLTMDTIAALNFGIVISLNITALGIRRENQIVKETVRSGLIAGGVLIAVYCALAHVGALSGDRFGASANGAETLADTVQFLFGKPGLVLLGAIFFIACLNTCVGLLSCCSRYFCTLLPKVGYRGWAVFFAVISLVIANAGLNRILEISVPVLNAIYPVAIVLIALAFFFPEQRYRSVYRGCILLTGIVSTISALDHMKVRIPYASQWLSALPFYELDLGWLLPDGAFSDSAPLNVKKNDGLACRPPVFLVYSVSGLMAVRG